MRACARHEWTRKVRGQYAGVRSWREELFSFPVPHSCSLRGRRICVPRRRHSCRGHQTQTEGRGGTETTCEGRLGEWVSCVWGEWRSWQAAFKQRRLRAVSRGQAARLMRRVSWSRVSANRICWHIWNCICGIAARMVFRAPAHKNLCAPRRITLLCWRVTHLCRFDIISGKHST